MAKSRFFSIQEELVTPTGYIAAKDVKIGDLVLDGDCNFVPVMGVKEKRIGTPDAYIFDNNNVVTGSPMLAVECKPLSYDWDSSVILSDTRQCMLLNSINKYGYIPSDFVFSSREICIEALKKIMPNKHDYNLVPMQFLSRYNDLAMRCGAHIVCHDGMLKSMPLYKDFVDTIPDDDFKILFNYTKKQMFYEDLDIPLARAILTANPSTHKEVLKGKDFMNGFGDLVRIETSSKSVVLRGGTVIGC